MLEAAEVHYALPFLEIRFWDDVIDLVQRIEITYDTYRTSIVIGSASIIQAYHQEPFEPLE